MYRCQITGKTSKRGEKLNRVVVKTRDKVYTQKVWEDGDLVEIEVGRGYETVKEIAVSDEGLKLYKQMVEDGTVANFLRNM